jgi:predicted Zn-dependent peptidase
MSLYLMNHETNSKLGFFYEEIEPGVHLIADCVDRQSCNIEIVYHVGGSFFEQDNDRGKKHLLEHCIVARTKAMDHQSLKDWEFRENINLNAYTARFSMAVTASGFKDDFVKMFDMLLESALSPTFSQEDLDREKEIVLREISERRGDPNYKLYYYVQNQIYTPDSTEVHEVLGDSAKVAQTTIEDFKRLHKENLEQSHLIIMVSGGGIDIDYIKQQVRQGLKNLNMQFNRKPINIQGKSKFLDFDFKPVVHELAHEHAEITFIVPQTVDFDSRPARSVFHALFMQYGGVLYDRLRDEKQLVYGLSSWADLDTQTFMINMEAEIEKLEQIEAESRDVFSDFDKYFKPQKFEEFKNLIYKKQALAKDKLGSSASFTHSNLITFGIFETYDEFTNKLKEVTITDIQRIYEELQANWSKKRVLVVSKDAKINNLKF